MKAVPSGGTRTTEFLSSPIIGAQPPRHRDARRRIGRVAGRLRADDVWVFRAGAPSAAWFVARANPVLVVQDEADS